MKLKTLRKKIRRIETRIQEDSKKLAKLKRKLDTVAAAKARKTKKRLATRAVALQVLESPRPTKTGSSDVAAKRKPNISPERRAQLSAAMKARWAAKRAAAETNAQNARTGQDFGRGQAQRSP